MPSYLTQLSEPVTLTNTTPFEFGTLQLQPVERAYAD